MNQAASQPDPETGRSAERVPLRAAVQFRAGTRRCEVTVQDLSTHGARITFAQALRAGDQFYLKLPQLKSIEAEVVWVENFVAGCRFKRPLHPATFAAVIRNG